eukprot:473679_1
MSTALQLIDSLIKYVDAQSNDEQKEDSNNRVTSETANALRKDVESLLREKKCAPILVRLAWHDAGTFCAKDNSGGSRAAQRFDDGESKHGANAGLGIARNLLSDLVKKYCNDKCNVSIADLWAYAGNTAIAFTGGPDVAFKFGRSDIKSSAECVEEGRLPDGDKGLEHLRTVFNRMGFNDTDIVALSGAHTLGSCHGDRSGFEGFWTAQPLKFDNSYYVDLINKKWAKTESTKGNVQLKNAEDDKDKTMMLTTDHCLYTRKETKSLVEKYAKDQKAFFNDFSVAWTKLIQNGYDNLYSPCC